MRHTVVLSDVHLCEVEPEPGLWMRYRQRPFLPDGELVRFLDTLREEVEPGSLTLVWNGDLFDLDAPHVVEGRSVFQNEPRTEANAVRALSRILDDHPDFVAALARVLSAGHTVVFVAGNHDVQLGFPAVRDLVTSRLLLELERAPGGGREPLAPAEAERVRARVLFRAWFYLSPDGILVEHGHQYDTYCAYRYPMAPTRERGEIPASMGSLVTRLLVSRMGYFNPHVESSFMLTLWGYVRHWARYYLVTRRSLALAWARGAVCIMRELVRRRQRPQSGRRDADVRAAALETGAGERALRRHAALFARPAEEDLHRAARELWLDRALFALATVTAAALWPALGQAVTPAAALLFPLALVAYELLVPKPPLVDERRLARISRRIARLHGARAVVLGHTHLPSGRRVRGVFLGNSGSWAASYHDVECSRPVDGDRSFIWLSVDPAGGPLRGGLVSFPRSRSAPSSPAVSPSYAGRPWRAACTATGESEPA